MSEKGPLVTQLEQKLNEAFNPATLDVINESHLHAGHQPGFDGQGESHIRIRMTADHFNGMSRVNIHREVNALCADEFEAGLHALAIDVKGTA
ncbi:BolA family transcriptional regulator [Ahrensia sp. R2A130]|uniref:BolA family protein n=1 Tax=Ahrensia sp. R2A130 TaxID=744979 RepID=UPI0001E0E0F7|nr:BolA family protein [Ahrensia sp. R2A130]EFL87977.1 UV-induced protein Uvi31 [Ahrensia sp. R2A130]